MAWFTRIRFASFLWLSHIHIDVYTICWIFSFIHDKDRNISWHILQLPNEDGITRCFCSMRNFTVQVWERIISFIPHFIIDVITYPCWDLSQTIRVKVASGVRLDCVEWFLSGTVKTCNTVYVYTAFKIPLSSSVYMVFSPIVACCTRKM